MPGLTDYGELLTLDSVLGKARAWPATVYISLFTVEPTEAGGGTEPAVGAYARVAVTNNATNWPNAAGGQKSNGTTVQFPQATANWGTVSWFGIHDAATAGNLIGWGALGVARSIVTGDAPAFGPGALVVTAD